MYRCIYPFVGVIGGALVQFAVGDKISAKDAREMGLADKPDIAEVIVADAQND